LAGGLLVAGVAAPAVAARVGRRLGRTEAPARGDLSAELLEVLAGGAELAVYGQEDERIARLRRVDRKLVWAANRAALADGLGDGLRTAVMGATVIGVLAVAVAAHSSGSLDGVLIAALA